MSKTIFEFFDLRENPFTISPDPRFMFLTPEARAASDELIYGIQHRKGLILLTGEVGTGKTMLVRHLLNWLSDQKMPTALIFNARLSSDNLLDFVLNDFGVSCKSSVKSDKLICLNNWLLQRYRADRIPVLIVDEAQGLPIQVLEEIRLLLNFETPRDKLLQIVLAGQPELDDTLKRHELRQLRQRITVRCKTAPLTFEQTRSYVCERLRIAGAKAQLFSPDSMAYLYSYSRGIPRVINVLCERALMNAFADNAKLAGPQHVELAAEDSQLEGIESISRVLHSGSASGSLGSIDAILAGVSQDDSYVDPPNRARLSRRFPIESMPSMAETLRSEQSMQGAAQFTSKSTEGFSERGSWRTHAEVEPHEIKLDTAFPQSAVPARGKLQTYRNLKDVGAWLDSTRYWLRGWSKSFTADVQTTISQLHRRLEFARLRYWLPFRRQLRRYLERLQDSAVRFASDPRWNQWQTRLSAYSQKAPEFLVRIRERFRGRGVTSTKPTNRTIMVNRRVASLRRWLQQPMERRRHPSRSATARRPQNESPQL